MTRKSPFDKCRNDARDAAANRKPVHACPYKWGAWRTVWLKAFTDAVQQDWVNERNDNDHLQQNP